MPIGQATLSDRDEIHLANNEWVFKLENESSRLSLPMTCRTSPHTRLDRLRSSNPLRSEQATPANFTPSPPEILSERLRASHPNHETPFLQFAESTGLSTPLNNPQHRRSLRTRHLKSRTIALSATFESSKRPSSTLLPHRLKYLPHGAGPITRTASSSSTTKRETANGFS